MSMATTLLSNISAAGHPDLPQVMEILACRRGHGSSHFFFFFFGSGGFFLGLPLLILGLFGAHLMRNPDKAKSYKQRLQQGISAMTSKAPHSSYSPHNATAPPRPPGESSPVRPPRIDLGPQPKSPQTHPAPTPSQGPTSPPALPRQGAPRMNLRGGQPIISDSGPALSAPRLADPPTLAAVRHLYPNGLPALLKVQVNKTGDENFGKVGTIDQYRDGLAYVRFSLLGKQFPYELDMLQPK